MTEMQRGLHVYLDQAEYHVKEDRRYEEEYEGGGCGPQSAELIFFIKCAAQIKNLF